MEFFATFFGLKSAKIFLISAGFVVLSGFIPYFEKYIYFNFLCFVLFNVSMVIDVISGIMLSKVRGDSFETNKAMKALIKIIGYNYLLYLSHLLFNLMSENGVVDSVYQGLKAVLSDNVANAIRIAFEEYDLSPYMVFLYAFIIISLSAVKNFQLADAFQNIRKFDRWVYKHIDVYKNRPTDRLWNMMSVSQQEKILKRLKKNGKEEEC